jgi:hypothetical protein
MQRVRVSTIRVGQRFDQPLYSAAGRKLIGAKVKLTETHLRAIRRAGGVTLFAAANERELIDAGVLKPAAASR